MLFCLYKYVLFNIRTIFWNVNGFKSYECDIKVLCNHYDVFFLQELWLCEDELNKLKVVNPNFSGFGVSAIDTKSGILSGRPHGGVCILWERKKYLSSGKKHNHVCT